MDTRAIVAFFLLITAAFLGAAVAVIVVALRPEKPEFSLHSISINFSKINASSSLTTHSSESAGIMLLVAGNPNKFGIQYSPSALGVFSEGSPIGEIKLPEFYQPPRSSNVSLEMGLFFQRLDLIRLTHGETFGSFYRRPEVVGAQITGRVRAQLRILSFSLPKIKVFSPHGRNLSMFQSSPLTIWSKQIAVRCRIIVGGGSVTISKAIKVLETRKAILLSNFPQLSQKCSWALRL